MRVFLTGGSGYIGSAVLDSLVRAGHHVDALVRNREKAADVQVRGAHPVIGDLATARHLAAVAAAADGAIHAAMDDSPRGPGARRAGARHASFDASAPGRRAAAGRFFIYTSGVWVLGAGADAGRRGRSAQPIEKSAWRVPHEERVLAAAELRVFARWSSGPASSTAAAAASSATSSRPPPTAWCG